MLWYVCFTRLFLQSTLYFCLYYSVVHTVDIRLILNNSKGKRERSGKYFAVKTLEMHRLVSRSGWMALDPNTSIEHRSLNWLTQSVKGEGKVKLSLCLVLWPHPLIKRLFTATSVTSWTDRVQGQDLNWTLILWSESRTLLTRHLLGHVTYYWKSLAKPVANELIDSFNGN